MAARSRPSSVRGSETGGEALDITSPYDEGLVRQHPKNAIRAGMRSFHCAHPSLSAPALRPPDTYSSVSSSAPCRLLLPLLLLSAAAPPLLLPAAAQVGSTTRASARGSHPSTCRSTGDPPGSDSTGGSLCPSSRS